MEKAVQKDTFLESCRHCGFIQPLGTAEKCIRLDVEEKKEGEIEKDYECYDAEDETWYPCTKKHYYAQAPSCRRAFIRPPIMFTLSDMEKAWQSFRMKGFPHNTDNHGNETFQQFIKSLKSTTHA